MYSQNNIRQVPMNNFLGASQTAYAVEADMGQRHLTEGSNYPPTYPVMSPTGQYMTTDYQGSYIGASAPGHTPQSAYSNVTSHHGYLQPGLPLSHQSPQQFLHSPMAVVADPYASSGSGSESAEAPWKYEQACENHGLLNSENSRRTLIPSPTHVADPEYRRSLSPRERALKENGLYVCSHCGDRYARRDRMDNCWNSHFNIKPHVCKGECGEATCNLTYANADALRRHQKKDQREVLCEWCKHPTSRQNLARHRLRCPGRPADYTGN